MHKTIQQNDNVKICKNYRFAKLIKFKSEKLELIYDNFMFDI